MHDMLSELKTLRSRWQKQYQNHGFSVHYPTLNFGCIHGGDNPNRICNSCELHFDFRGLPVMQNDVITEKIRQHLQAIAKQHQVDMLFEPLFEHVEPFAEDKHSELVQLAEKLTQQSAEAVAFATEAPFLKDLSMQTIVLGAGSIDQAHQPDEIGRASCR